MRRNETEHIKEVIGTFLKEFKLEKGIRESLVIQLWPELMGPAIANRTDDIYFKDSRLFIKASSSVVKNELFMMRSQIKNIFNKKVGDEVIKEVIIR